MASVSLVCVDCNQPLGYKVNADGNYELLDAPSHVCRHATCEWCKGENTAWRTWATSPWSWGQTWWCMDCDAAAFGRYK